MTRIENCIQKFDELYQEYVKQEKAKDIKETSISHQAKRRKVDTIEPSSSTLTSLPQQKEEATISLVSYDHSDDEASA